ncbi:hypothetical protein BJ878DRAFT_554887 [Calycina marina]|uniref:Uncharacterized protein n=1 Tax=Calycina marina TaxID=1763456 RepID=A0A9P7YZK1_9HELO|nr:hypothetical protein BJ878DRAFT_554887 [Calycina marina]
MAEDTQDYSPSVGGVLDVKDFLFEKFQLPVEILDTIIDHAQYWPHTTVKTTTSTTVNSGAGHENRFIIRSYPIGFDSDQQNLDPQQQQPIFKNNYPYTDPIPWPLERKFPQESTKSLLDLWRAKSQYRAEHPCAKIVFTTKSHDQGWGDGGNHGETYTGSYTWFDVGLEKISAAGESGRQTTAGLAQLAGNVPSPHFYIFNAKNITDKISPLPVICSHRTIIPMVKEVPKDPEPVVGPDDCDPNSEDKPDLIAKKPEHEPEKMTYEFDHPLLPGTDALQKNITAKRNIQECVITWSAWDDINPESLEANELANKGRGSATGTGDFVRGLVAGDVVTVWAKSRFPGWTNNVEGVQIDVYWRV